MNLVHLRTPGATAGRAPAGKGELRHPRTSPRRARRVASLVLALLTVSAGAATAGAAPVRGAGTAVVVDAVPDRAAVVPAHPLGNFTVNYHTGLVLHRDRADATVIVDRAEISTLQELARVDRDADGTPAPGETAAYARSTCSVLGGQLDARLGGAALRWRPGPAGLRYEPGEAGLRTSRLSCTFSASADLSRPADVTVRTSYDTRRVGWREMTVRGEGLRVTGTTLPATSPTGELRRYPADPLATPLDQHSARLHTEPGATGAAPPGTPTASGGSWPTVYLAKVTTLFDSLVGTRELTLPVGLLALLLAVVLGASHALLPGHGKTIMAAYLAGRRGTRRDAVTVGATVTLTHTAGVLVLGLALPTATHLAGETVLTWLGATSGLIVTGIGLWLLNSAVGGRNPLGHHHHGGGAHGHHHHGGGAHGHDHHGGGAHGHDHHGRAPHGHGHDHHHGGGAHSHDHHHGPQLLPQARATSPRGAHAAVPGSTATLHEAVAPTGVAPAVAGPGPARVAQADGVESRPRSAHPHGHPPERKGRAGLIGMGVAGGLVPSPSALVVLLGAVALGRTVFGMLLVLAYGLGMAGTLTLAGLLLVRLRGRLEKRGPSASHRLDPLLRKLTAVGPLLTSLLVVLVGLGITLRAALDML